MLQEIVEKYPDGIIVGEAVPTFGHKLKAMYVIHTVGPHYMNVGIDHEALLASCYRRSLEEADRLGLTSIAFPAISTGAYLYPFEDALRVAIRTIREFEPQSLEDVHLVFVDQESADKALRALSA